MHGRTFGVMLRVVAVIVLVYVGSGLIHTDILYPLGCAFTLAGGILCGWYMR